MRKLVTALLCLTVSVSAALAVGCAGGNNSSDSTSGSQETPVVNKITIGSKPAGALSVGATHTLTVTVTPETVTDYEVVWSSSDASVVSVNDGVLTALKAGTAMITATVKDTDIKDSFAVAVAEKVELNPATAIAIGGKPQTVRKGDTFTLTADITAEDADKDCTDSVSWSSTDEDVLTVDENGLVTVKKTGKATVKAAIVGKTDELFDEYEIKVYPAVPADGVYRDDMKNATIGAAQGVLSVATLNGETLRGGTRYGNVSYSADDNGNLLVKGVDIRNYDRTYFEPKFDDILPDGNYTVRISVTLVEASKPEAMESALWTLYWWSKERATEPIDSQDESKTIARLVEDGKVQGNFDGVGSELVLTLNTNKPLRGIAFGTSQTQGENSNYTVKINEISFTRYSAVEGFEISNKTDIATIRTDDTDKAIVYDYTNKTGDDAATAFEVEYESSAPSVLTVDKDGKITPVGAGTATVTAKVVGQSAFDTVEITVEHIAVESISITRGGEAAGDTIREDIKGKTVPYTIQLGYAVTGNPCAFEVEWESSNEDAATVDENGLVTVKAVGTARITVSVKGQTAKKSVNIVVEDSTIVKVIDEIKIKVNGVLAGADDKIIRLGETVELGYEVTFADGEKAFTVEWTSDTASVVEIPEAGKNAATVTLNIKAVGTAAVKVKVIGKDETAEFTVNFVVKKPLVTAIELDGVDATQTMKIGESKDFTVTATPADCDEYELEAEYTENGIVKLEKTANGYRVVPVGTGTTDVTLKVKGSEDVTATFSVTVSGLLLQSETFENGSVIDGVYYGDNFNVGVRTGGSTLGSVTKTDDGIEWSAWSLGDQRMTLQYKNYDNLDFSDGKKYIARVAVKTSASYPDSGYVTIYGYKKIATDSYKNPNGGTNDVVATGAGGSTARVVLGGKGVTIYYDFILDGSNSSEFFFAYHSGSNSGKSGATVAITVTDITVFDADSYVDYDAIEDFENSTTEANVNKLVYTGETFGFTASAGDTMQVVDLPAAQLSARTSGKGLYWVSARVWKKGLTESTDETPVAVTHPKMIITYNGERVEGSTYKVTIPLYMSANNKDQVKTTTVEVYYATSGTYSEKHLVTRTVGYADTLTVLEGEIPADAWNGQIVIRMFNSEITTNAAGSKMLCYFDGVSIKKI